MSSASLESITVLDQVEEALALGRVLVADAPSPALAGATFRRAVAGAWPDLEADLVTVSYVLSELDQRQQDALVADAMRRGRAVVVVEPGTPDGYARVAARPGGTRWRQAGPCSVRAPTSALSSGTGRLVSLRGSRRTLREHRRLKGAELSYEDEKFSWVAAAAPGVMSSHQAEALSGRILRHPLKRKGFVEFQVCRPDGTAGREVVSKKAGERYRRARDAEWGDTLP